MSGRSAFGSIAVLFFICAVIILANPGGASPFSKKKSKYTLPQQKEHSQLHNIRDNKQVEKQYQEPSNIISDVFQKIKDIFRLSTSENTKHIPSRILMERERPWYGDIPYPELSQDCQDLMTASGLDPMLMNYPRYEPEWDTSLTDCSDELNWALNFGRREMVELKFWLRVQRWRQRPRPWMDGSDSDWSDTDWSDVDWSDTDWSDSDWSNKEWRDWEWAFGKDSEDWDTDSWYMPGKRWNGRPKRPKLPWNWDTDSWDTDSWDTDSWDMPGRPWNGRQRPPWNMDSEDWDSEEWYRDSWDSDSWNDWKCPLSSWTCTEAGDGIVKVMFDPEDTTCTGESQPTVEGEGFLNGVCVNEYPPMMNDDSPPILEDGTVMDSAMSSSWMPECVNGVPMITKYSAPDCPAGSEMADAATGVAAVAANELCMEDCQGMKRRERRGMFKPASEYCSKSCKAAASNFLTDFSATCGVSAFGWVQGLMAETCSSRDYDDVTVIDAPVQEDEAAETTATNAAGEIMGRRLLEFHALHHTRKLLDGPGPDNPGLPEGGSAAGPEAQGGMRDEEMEAMEGRYGRQDTMLDRMICEETMWSTVGMFTNIAQMAVWMESGCAAKDDGSFCWDEQTWDFGRNRGRAEAPIMMDNDWGISEPGLAPEPGEAGNERDLPNVDPATGERPENNGGMDNNRPTANSGASTGANAGASAGAGADPTMRPDDANTGGMNSGGSSSSWEGWDETGYGQRCEDVWPPMCEREMCSAYEDASNCCHGAYMAAESATAMLFCPYKQLLQDMRLLDGCDMRFFESVCVSNPSELTGDFSSQMMTCCDQSSELPTCGAAQDSATSVQTLYASRADYAMSILPTRPSRDNDAEDNASEENDDDLSQVNSGESVDRNEIDGTDDTTLDPTPAVVAVAFESYFPDLDLDEALRPAFESEYKTDIAAEYANSGITADDVEILEVVYGSVRVSSRVLFDTEEQSTAFAADVQTGSIFSSAFTSNYGIPELTTTPEAGSPTVVTQSAGLRMESSLWVTAAAAMLALCAILL